MQKEKGILLRFYELRNEISYGFAMIGFLTEVVGRDGRFVTSKSAVDLAILWVNKDLLSKQVLLTKGLGV